MKHFTTLFTATCTAAVCYNHQSHISSYIPTETGRMVNVVIRRHLEVGPSGRTYVGYDRKWMSEAEYKLQLTLRTGLGGCLGALLAHTAKQKSPRTMPLILIGSGFAAMLSIYDSQLIAEETRGRDGGRGII